MNNIYLTSSIHRVAQDIADKLTTDDFWGRRLCFIITASEQDTEDLEWRDNDRNALIAAGFEVEDYTFTGHTKQEIVQHLEQFDVICVEGGNTFHLLRTVQQLDLKEVLVQFVAQGKIYLGCSAGSIVAGPDIYPLRRTGRDVNLSDYTGLQLTDVVILPHWGSDYRKEIYLTYRCSINYNEDHKLLLLTDNQYIATTNKPGNITIDFHDVTKK